MVRVICERLRGRDKGGGEGRLRMMMSKTVNKDSEERYMSGDDGDSWSDKARERKLKGASHRRLSTR